MSQVQDIFSFKTFVHALAGSLGGIFAMSTFYPLETVRSRIQVEDSNRYADKSTIAVICELVKNEGFLTLYRGMSPVLLTLGASNFIYFYTFHGLKTVNQQSIGNDLLIGIIAGVVNVFITSPLWVVNSRLKMNGVGINTPYNSLLPGVWHILKHEGIKKLWSGLLPSLVLVANPAIQFMTYEALKRQFLTNLDPREVHGCIYFVLGAIAKTVATITTYPLQVVQTRLRYGIKDHYNLHPNAGTIELLFYILKRQGFKGLFTGLEAKLLQTVLTAALMFVTYEKIANFVFSLLLNKRSDPVFPLLVIFVDELSKMKIEPGVFDLDKTEKIKLDGNYEIKIIENEEKIDWEKRHINNQSVYGRGNVLYRTDTENIDNLIKLLIKYTHDPCEDMELDFSIKSQEQMRWGTICPTKKMLFVYNSKVFVAYGRYIYGYDRTYVTINRENSINVKGEEDDEEDEEDVEEEDEEDVDEEDSDEEDDVIDEFERKEDELSNVKIILSTPKPDPNYDDYYYSFMIYDKETEVVDAFGLYH